MLQKSQPIHRHFFQLLSWLPCLYSSLADSAYVPEMSSSILIFPPPHWGFAWRDNSSISCACERRLGCWQTDAGEETKSSEVWGEKGEPVQIFLGQGARLDRQSALDRWANYISEEFKKGSLSQGGFWRRACNYICFSEVNRICSLDFHFHAQSLELQVPPVNTMQTKYNWLPQESLWKAAPWD